MATEVVGTDTAADPLRLSSGAAVATPRLPSEDAWERGDATGAAAGSLASLREGGPEPCSRPAIALTMLSISSVERPWLAASRSGGNWVRLVVRAAGGGTSLRDGCPAPISASLWGRPEALGAGGGASLWDDGARAWPG